MSVPLKAMETHGVLNTLDRHLAEALSQLAGEQSPSVVLAVALASRQTRAGHVCVDLGAFADSPMVDEAGNQLYVETGPLRWPSLDNWFQSLSASPLVSDGQRRTPLVLDAHGRVYLYRYWEHERRIFELLRSRVALVNEPVDREVLQDGLKRYFGTSKEPDAQRDAALVALTERVCTIVGGPGTGKTATVARILALLTEQWLKLHGRPPKTLLLAPTGKAAARLVDSIRLAKATLDASPSVLDGIAEQASTIHRALGSRRGSLTRFYHHSGHPLLADVVLVDEASMVDVALMRRLLEATGKTARVILLGDRHQLASVEAGSVLADICGSGAHPGYAQLLVERVQDIAGISLPARPSATLSVIDSVVELTKSYRFLETSKIARFSRAVNTGDADAALGLLRPGRSGDSELSLVQGDNESLLRALEGHTVARHRNLTRTSDHALALQQLNSFRVLCAHRTGPLGVSSINRRLEIALERAGLIRTYGEWYPGRPILVTSNDRHLNLFNGDVGLVLRDASGALRVVFDAGGGDLRSLSPSRLPPHETVFAMSIHKSQGSEFKEVAIVLPRPGSPLLTRELLYTAVTRARERATLYADPESVRVGVGRQVLRTSGLGSLLHEN